MIRIDVFYVEDDGYYFVPIYVADTKREKLPNKAAVAMKPYNFMEGNEGRKLCLLSLSRRFGTYPSRKGSS